jgi:polysaccharide biosynthesis protein PslE
MIIQLTPRYIAYTLFKRWKVIVLFAVASVLTAALYIFLVPWRYESDARIVIKVSEDDVSDASITEQPGQAANPAIFGDVVLQIVNSRADILQSEDVTRATLQKLGVAKVYPEILASPPRFFGTAFDAANHRLIKDLTVTPVRGSNSLAVSLLNRNPQIAQETLRTLIAVFMDKQAQVMRNPRARFLEEQLVKARKRVDAAQSALLGFKSKKRIMSLDDERQLLLKQRDQLEANLASENTQTLGTSITEAHNVLATAEQRYLQAKQTYAPGTPSLEDARNALDLSQQQYDALLKSLANVGGSAPDSNVRPHESTPPAAKGGLPKTWTTQLESVNARLNHLNESEGDLLTLQRQLDVASEDYKAFLQRAADAHVSEALNEQGAAVSQEPTLPYQPARPRIFLVAALAILFGLIGGLGLCFLLEMADETIGMPEQVEPLLGLPVLATLNRDRAIRNLASSVG